MHCCLCDVLQLLAALAALLLVLVAVIAHVTARKMPNLHRHEEEKFFVASNGEKKPFPSIHDRPEKDLSVVVPAYNEEERLPVMMNEAMEFLEKRQMKRPSFKYEVIVVDDGSSDKTTQVALNYSKKYGSDKVRVLTLVKNRGKGGAVRMGVLVSRGKTILMADADGATKFADLELVEVGLDSLKPWPDNLAISCGSRAHLEKESIATGPAKGKTASKSTIARWIKTAIQEAYKARGLDPLGKIRAHSTRSLSSSWAEKGQASAEQICKAATWSSIHTFTRHYRVNVQSDKDLGYGRKVLQAVVPP
ncbi:dolichyl-phosphate beta-glucosyltransferase isoform X2 [Eleutherodactylus coqui]|uniref:dolichyl-phosphate beta-glucosyltransferase isoform X2 n=1 Tax=Eleutherodactylus coqui TaxID=57060 RepID=UPI0034618320